jgi:hypothetical protein
VTVDQFRALLEKPEIARPGIDIAAWTAPASGLFLEVVKYP